MFWFILYAILCACLVYELIIFESVVLIVFLAIAVLIWPIYLLIKLIVTILRMIF